MKKTLLFIAVIASAMFTNAQAIWKVTGTEASIAAGTDIPTGIADLKVMHSDVAGVVGKGDTGATNVTYNGVTWDNLAMMQGNSNGMYYAFLPSKSGTLDVGIKMGSNKKTFVLEVQDNLYTSIPATVGDLAALTTGFGTADLITAEYYTVPSVYDTYNNSIGVWDGTVAIQATGANVYMVISIPVSANKTYVVGCFGSKLMLRGAALTSTTNISNVKAPEMKVYPNPASGKVFINVDQPSEIGIYSLTGSLVKQQFVTSSNNSVNISELNSGIYFVKMMNSNNFTQKLIIQ